MNEQTRLLLDYQEQAIHLDLRAEVERLTAEVERLTIENQILTLKLKLNESI
tara:strand:+ start:91 stop:246 length:156 start_codon:yes stop_codon:yes gene_type:complete